MLDVYAAREDPAPGVTGELVADAVAAAGGAGRCSPRTARPYPRVARRARPGDLVLTMGAGDVTALGPEILAALAATGRG